MGSFVLDALGRAETLLAEAYDVKMKIELENEHLRLRVKDLEKEIADLKGSVNGKVR